MKRLVLYILILISVQVKAQDNYQSGDSIEEMFYISTSFTSQMPFGDLKNDFGYNSNIGLALNFKGHKNFTYGLSWSFLFGKNIKNEFEIFENIITEKGYFLTKNGDYANVKLFERGHLIMLNAGKIFPVSKKNLNSGLHLKFGAGYMQHKIKSLVEFDNVPQLVGDYKKLYDRFSSGFAISQFIGYSHFSNSQLVNFYGGFEIIEAFTVGRRDYQASLERAYHDQRLDILIGAKVGWMIPFRRRRVSDYYFY